MNQAWGASLMIRVSQIVIQVHPTTESMHTRSINLHQLRNQLLHLIELEPGERRPLGTVVQALAIQVRAEQTQLAIIATVDLHALEALSGVVEARGRRRDAEILVRLDLGGLPAVAHSPPHGDHVVSAVRVAHFLGRARQRHIPQVGGAGDLEV